MHENIAICTHNHIILQTRNIRDPAIYMFVFLYLYVELMMNSTYM